MPLTPRFDSMERNRQRRELAGLRNTAANQGPPSSKKTFSSPPKKAPLLTRAAVAAGEIFGKEDKQSLLSRTGLQKIPQFVFPKYDKSAEQMSASEQREAGLNLLEVIPGIGDVAGIGRYTEGVSREPTNLGAWGSLLGMGALGIANPFGGAGQAKRGIKSAARDIEDIFDDDVDEPLNIGQERALRGVLAGVEEPDVAELRRIETELKPVQATYSDMRSLFDPSDVEFDYNTFTDKYPGGMVELPRSDLEGFLKDPMKGFEEAVGRYYGPRRGAEELEEKVPVRIVEWTPESQYNALSRHGQVGGPRQKQITASMRKLYGKLGYPVARRESSLNAIRRNQLDSYNEAELQRIYGSDTSRYKAVEIDPETGDPKWYRSSHADHLVARKRIERRVDDIVNSVSKGSSPSEKQKAKELAEAYYEFQNMSTNFISLHGLENVRKSDLETGAWLKDIISKPYNKLPEDKKPIKAAYESALEELRARVGDKEFKTFMSKY
jgi:hypothetical protein